MAADPGATPIPDPSPLVMPTPGPPPNMGLSETNTVYWLTERIRVEDMNERERGDGLHESPAAGALLSLVAQGWWLLNSW